MSTTYITRFFNLRTDRWAEHFALAELAIEPLTAIGEATARIFRFNIADRIVEREALAEAGRYPSDAARRRIES